MKKMIAGLPGIVLGVFGLMPTVFWGLIVLMSIDIGSGWLLASGHGVLSSDASWKGFTKKAITLLLVVALRVAETIQPMPIELSAYVAGWFCATEVISIAENAGKAGIRLPRRVIRMLAQLQDEKEKP